jgi:hypothetical protein
MALVSPGNRQGSWVFRIVHGRPPQFPVALGQLQAAKIWVLIWGMAVTIAACLAFQTIAPAELRVLPAIAAQLLTAAGMCVLLTDLLFLSVKVVPFTGEMAREPSNLAFTVLKYFAFLPLVSALPLALTPWMEKSTLHCFFAVAAIASVHFLLTNRYRRVILEHTNLRPLEEDEEDFPMSLGLRY